MHQFNNVSYFVCYCLPAFLLWWSQRHSGSVFLDLCSGQSQDQAKKAYKNLLNYTTKYTPFLLTQILTENFILIVSKLMKEIEKNIFSKHLLCFLFIFYSMLKAQTSHGRYFSLSPCSTTCALKLVRNVCFLTLHQFLQIML